MLWKQGGKFLAEPTPRQQLGCGGESAGLVVELGRAMERARLLQTWGRSGLGPGTPCTLRRACRCVWEQAQGWAGEFTPWSDVPHEFPNTFLLGFSVLWLHHGSRGLVVRTLSEAAFPPVRVDTAKSPAGRTLPGCNKAAHSAAGWSRPNRDCQLN